MTKDRKLFTGLLEGAQKGLEKRVYAITTSRGNS